MIFWSLWKYIWAQKLHWITSTLLCRMVFGRNTIENLNGTNSLARITIDRSQCRHIWFMPTKWMLNFSNYYLSNINHVTLPNSSQTYYGSTHWNHTETMLGFINISFIQPCCNCNMRLFNIMLHSLQLYILMYWLSSWFNTFYHVMVMHCLLLSCQCAIPIICKSKQ